MGTSGNSRGDAAASLPKLEKNVLLTLAREFADMTLMHGIHFISNNRASIPERALWLILFCIGFGFSLTCSWSLWAQWVNSPVLITIDSANYPIAMRPFPTITVCNTNRISTKALGKWISSNGERFAGLDIEEIRRALQIIATNQIDSEEEVVKLSKTLAKTNISSENHYYEELMNLLTPSCSDMVIFCSWSGKEEDCFESKFIEQESTEDGYCCSFNSVVIYKNGTKSNKVLRYTHQSGLYGGMSVILNTKINDYNITSSDTIGFKVSIQPPEDFARTGRVGFMVSPGRQYEVGISGEAQMALKSIGDIDISKRLCSIDDEFELQHFSDYTSAYCVVDCQARLFIERCQCVPYNYPVSNDLPVCNLSSYVCLSKTREYQLLNISACYCPEKCNQTWYRNEISQGLYPNPSTDYPASIYKRKEFRNMNKSELRTYGKDNFAKLSVFFKSTTGVGYIVSHRITWAEFIAAAGGLLGLGFGFSLLSLAEIFYFLCVRWMYHLYQVKVTKKNKFPIAENHIGAASAATSNFPPAVLYDSRGEQWRIERSSQNHQTVPYINTWVVEPVYKPNNGVLDDCGYLS